MHIEFKTRGEGNFAQGRTIISAGCCRCICCNRTAAPHRGSSKSV